MDLQIDSDGLGYIRASKPSNLVLEGINGSLLVRASWTHEASESVYRPVADTVTINHVAIGAFLDELTRICSEIARSRSGSYKVMVSGSPLGFSLEARGETMTVRLVEFVDYSDQKRTLGRSEVHLGSFFRTVSDLVERFVGLVSKENPAINIHPGLASFLKDAKVLRSNA